MNAFELYATLTLNSSGFQQALSGAKNGMSSLVKSAAMTQLAVAGVEKAFQAVASVTKQSVANYGEYEQLIGGIEKLFGKSADTVTKNAQKAFKTAQISQNQYMSLATTFSASLIQGLSGNTEKAAELTNTAITDMADNANVFGTSMTDIENAYKGFAKQNYTMLDNLKLGYGGTREEMLRLVNDSGISKTKIEDLDDVSFSDIISAIHQIQTNLKITGTTSTEAATTLEGSANTMKASFQDFLTSISTGDESEINTKMAQFQSSFDTYMSNLIPVAIKAVGGSGALVKGVMDAITNISADDLAELANSGVSSAADIINGFTGFTQWLIDGLTAILTNPQAGTNTQELGAALGNFISTTVRNLVSNVPQLLTGLVDLGLNIGAGLIEGIIQGFSKDDSASKQMVEKISGIEKDLTDSITNAIEKSTKASGIVSYMQSLIDRYGEAAKSTEEWQNAVTQLETVLPGASEIIDAHKGDISGVVGELQAAIDKEKEYAIESARRKAVEDKYNALVKAQTELAVASDSKSFYQSQIDQAKQDVQSYYDNGNQYAQAGMNSYVYDEATGQFDMSKFMAAYQTYGSELASMVLNPSGMNTEITQEDIASLQGVFNSLAESQTAYDSAKSSIDDLTSAVITAQASYDIANKAATDAAAADTNFTSNTNKAAEASSNYAARANAARFANYNGVEGRATGMDYVPYDDYYARLHKGEAVLTRAEATIWRKGASNGFTSYNEHNNIYVGTMQMGTDYSADELMNNVAAYQRRRNAGYGM